MDQKICESGCQSVYLSPAHPIRPSYHAGDVTGIGSHTRVPLIAHFPTLPYHSPEPACWRICVGCCPILSTSHRPANRKVVRLVTRARVRGYIIGIDKRGATGDKG